MENVLIIDDETYVTLTAAQLPVRQFVNEIGLSKVETEEKTKISSKLRKKFHVLQNLVKFGKVSKVCVHEGFMPLQTIFFKQVIAYFTSHI